MCHAYFMVSEKNSDSVCMYAFHNAYNFYVHQYMFFPGLNVLFHHRNGWQGFQMIKKHFNLNNGQNRLWIIHVNAQIRG